MAETLAEDVRVIPYINKMELTGYLGRDQFGRVYVDSCKTNEEHLKNHVEGKERPGCRKYIEDLFPDRMLGVRVFAGIGVYLEEDKETK